MRILVETALNVGVAEYLNMGDVAMLQVAVTRLKSLWPSASIEVLTESPENLARYCPGAKPILRVGRDLWIGDRDTLHSFLFTRLYKQLPNGISSWLSERVKALEQSWPKLLKSMIRYRPLIGNGGEEFKNRLIDFLETMENVDLFVVCGAGGFADDCRRWNWSTLNTLETFIHHNIPVVMFGQGMGPLDDTDVLLMARRVFPKVKLITLRGGRGGLALLESLGVDPSNVLTTGDEAIELAYEAKPENLGFGLGINLRVASYAHVGNDLIPQLKSVLQQFARQHDVPMIPVPIAFHPWASDHITIKQLLAGFNDHSDGGITLDAPLKIVEQVGRCRIIVTGAYHAAVFALSQGIPVVCLANSPYYVAKFLGLKDQFGLGCETVLLNDSDVFQKLPIIIERVWQSADMVRLPLQQAALRQIKVSRSAYAKVQEVRKPCPN
jgi:colanic acid/amylovoran biosynthesis protein